MPTWTVQAISFAEAKALIEQGHYIGHLRKSGIQIGLFRDEVLVGVAVFGQPSREGVARSLGGTLADVIELLRFYTVDDLNHSDRGTWFLRRAIKLLPRQYNVVVAYSDPGAQHHGGLYRAASWTYLGRTNGTPYWYVDLAGKQIGKQTPWKQARRAVETTGIWRLDELPRGWMAAAEREYAAMMNWRRVYGETKYRYVMGRTVGARTRLRHRFPPRHWQI